MAAILGAILDFVKGSNVFVGTYVFQNLRISIQFGSLCLKHIFRWLKCVLELPSWQNMWKMEMAAILGAILDFWKSSSGLIVLVCFKISE